MDNLLQSDGDLPSQRERRQAWAALESIIADAHENVRQSGISQEELDRTIDEACDNARRDTHSPMS